MVRPDQDRIGGKSEEHVKADETCIGWRTRGKGRGRPRHGSRCRHGRSPPAQAAREPQQTQNRALRRACSPCRCAGSQSQVAGRIHRAHRCTRRHQHYRRPERLREAGRTRLLPYRRRGAGRHASCRHLPADHSPRVLQSQDLGCVASITVSARNTYKPISTNSPSASTAASTLSTPSVLCSASLAMSPRPRNLISTPQNPDLLHLVSVCDNPISTV